LNEKKTAWLSFLPAICQKLGLVEHADKLDFEAFFNHFEPFYYGLVLYFIAFILACFALLGWSAPLNRAAFWLVAITLVMHTAAMIGRMYISGRPPVTNLYSAALFIGWAGVAIGLVLELVFRLGIGTMIGALAGFMTLVIAHFLATSGDTFTVMEAVLDTQFWLATHVTCITLGYATTFFAGLIGTRYILQGVFSPSLPAAERKAMVRMIYGVLCFAIFFSFIGTVLGGLWADDSWGRFWGWDPKENGALIIVIWNALVLHARWDKMVKDRGLAVLSIGGIIAVAWSGFGVNQLGAGLHSYGFTNGVALGVAVTIAVSLGLIALGSLPLRYWRSFRAASPEAIA
jgi:ABC-type transport system involved in cytochrome c biogenesis permease subunit